jgi:hypothetical protein
MYRSLATVIAACGLAGCHAHAGDGGPTVSRNFQVANFQQIEIVGPYDVDVRTGSNASVSGRGGERLLERTVVEVRGDKLIIHPKEHHGFFNWSWGPRGKADFTVTVPQLSAATTTGSGDIRIDRVAGQEFEGTVAGSGGINVGSVEVQSLKLAIAGSGSAKTAGGKTQDGKYEIAGSGGIDAAAVQAQQLKISIAGSGDVRARASGTADVSIIGSGDVDVSGGAKCTINKTGSGDVRCS